jgi:hypothetical protein
MFPGFNSNQFNQPSEFQQGSEATFLSNGKLVTHPLHLFTCLRFPPFHLKPFYLWLACAFHLLSCELSTLNAGHVVVVAAVAITMPDPSDTTNSVQPTSMAERDRSGEREFYIYDAKELITAISSLAFTNANLWSMIEIVVLFTSAFELQDKDKTKI